MWTEPRLSIFPQLPQSPLPPGHGLDGDDPFNGGNDLDLSMNQTDLASLVGARREWVNRILRDWSKRGLIEYEHGKITILDLPAVEEERGRRIDLYAGDEEW
jgi:CRP-like cAMP-binding protein